ncbi:MAG: CAP domain-containing protein [Planctomycetes bacterium]|nr:CAP domain-containing protein [Planctomycetota bacterium]
MVTRRCWSSFAAAWCAWSLIIGATVAQEKVVPEPEEAEVLALGQKELDAYAALGFKNGFPRQARQVWLEVIGEYAPDDEAARKAIGFYKNGSVWQRDPKFDYPEQDTPDAGSARMLEQRWATLAQKLGEAHRQLAAKLAAAGKPARAAYHLQRAQRFLPDDAKVVAQAKAQAKMVQFEGVTGDEIDITVLRRSRLMDRAITQLSQQPVAVARCDEKLAMIDKAHVAYGAVKSEHFVVYGDWEPEVLQQAATWAERSLAFCEQAFAGYEGFPPRVRSRQLAFFKQKAQWTAVVRLSAPAGDVEFLVENASATEIDSVHLAAAEQTEVVYDLAVRWVAQDYAGLSADALEEGIGHAIVGMFFGKNLVFSVGQQKPEHTVSGNREQNKLLLPDMDTWRELAVEIAWQQGGTAAARLPLLKAAQFPSDARIKAWSFCDYLLRRDPLLLRRLQDCAPKSRTENDVLGEFQKLAGMPLQHVEDRWRRFWTEDSAIKRAVLSRTTPLEATSKEAPAWLEQFNRLRQQYDRAAVGWSSQLSIACKEHVDYLKANKDQRGPDKEHTQVPGKPAFSNSGRAFAATALVWTKDKDAKKAVEQWLQLPGYRDAILNPNIDTVGIYAEGGLVVIDASRGRNDKPQLTNALYPIANLQGGRARDPIPAAVDVDLLGPEVVRLLAAHKRPKQKQVGCPLTLHMYGATKNVTCKVTRRGAPVEGWLVAGDGSSRRTSAPGLWVFYPAEPLERGVDLRAEWTWDGGSHDVTFLAK